MTKESEKKKLLNTIGIIVGITILEGNSVENDSLKQCVYTLWHEIPTAVYSAYPIDIHTYDQGAILQHIFVIISISKNRVKSDIVIKEKLKIKK